MNDVKELTPSKPTQTISLSALKEDQTLNTVSINTVGESSVESSEKVTPQIKINTNIKKSRRTIGANEDVATVDPNDYIPKAEPKRGITLQEDAITKLDAAVARKREEFHEFVRRATEADEANREKIESGLETVQGEFEYLPSGVGEEESKETFDPQFVKKAENVSVETVAANDDDEIERDLEAELASDTDYERPTYLDFKPVNTDPAPIMEAVADDPVIEEKAEPIVVENIPVEEKKPAVNDDVFTGNYYTEGKSVKTSSVDVEAATTATTSNDFQIDEADLDDLAEGDNEEEISAEKAEEIRLVATKKLKDEILEKIVKRSKSMNTTSFTISNKVVSIKDAIKFQNLGADKARTAYWPMMHAGRPFVASSLKGAEIALLSDRDRNSPSGITPNHIRILYEHDANPYKPVTIEAWAKTIPYDDIDNLYVALFLASTKDANYVPMVCPKTSCQNMYLSDNINIDQMVKFDNDQIKERFEQIKNSQVTPDNSGTYESVVSVINDKFAIGFKIPSLYTIFYEYAALNENFANKYRSIVNIMQYIDYIYMINPETQEFTPIGWQPYPGDVGKTFKSKIATYAKILKEFDDTDFNILTALIASMVTKDSSMNTLRYEYPAAKCPVCGADIPARPVAAIDLVFTRQQLVELTIIP